MMAPLVADMPVGAAVLATSACFVAMAAFVHTAVRALQPGATRLCAAAPLLVGAAVLPSAFLDARASAMGPLVVRSWSAFSVLIRFGVQCTAAPYARGAGLTPINQGLVSFVSCECAREQNVTMC